MRSRGLGGRMDDPYNLDRFVTAQDAGGPPGTYERALDELRAGFKSSHWMWFVFPQIAGLGHSPTARRYAISSLAEAAAYLEHPVLGPRLRESARILGSLKVRSADPILGAVDAIKPRSSTPRLHRAAPE